MIIAPLSTATYYSYGTLINRQQAGEQFFPDFSRGYSLSYSCHFCATRAVMWLSSVILVSRVYSSVNRRVFQCICCLLVPAFIPLDTAS